MTNLARPGIMCPFHESSRRSDGVSRRCTGINEWNHFLRASLQSWTNRFTDFTGKAVRAHGSVRFLVNSIAENLVTHGKDWSSNCETAISLIIIFFSFTFNLTDRSCILILTNANGFFFLFTFVPCSPKNGMLLTLPT